MELKNKAIKKISFTPEGQEAEHFLRDLLKILNTSGQYELEVNVSFSDSPPMEEDLNNIKTNITHWEQDADGDIIWLSAKFSKEDDSWNSKFMGNTIDPWNDKMGDEVEIPD